MRAILSVAMALGLMHAGTQPAEAQGDFKVVEFEVERLQEIALVVAVEFKADKPAHLRDVIGVREGTLPPLVCGHALVQNDLGLSMGYKPFVGFITARDGVPPDGFILLNSGYPIRPADMVIYEVCERFGFRL